MKQTTHVQTVSIPKTEYGFLKELYKTVQRQKFILRVGEAEKNLKSGKAKKMPLEKFIESI
jgi:mRNA-degrading endonuclease YafQ of YafQ-DinJ toxin-antitoxin module